MQPVVELRDVEHFHWRLAETEVPLAFSNNGSGMSLAAAIELACIAAYKQRSSNEPSATIRVANCSVWSLVKATRWPERSSRTRLRDGDAPTVQLWKRPAFSIGRTLGLYQGYTQELQSEINERLLESMRDIAFDDWARFGKIRQAEEKRLRDPDDVFIQAEERRRELRKKRKRNKA